MLTFISQLALFMPYRGGLYLTDFLDSPEPLEFKHKSWSNSKNIDHIPY